MNKKQFSSVINDFLSAYLNLDNKGYTREVLTDLSESFDTINHKLLIAKLNAYAFSKEALKLIFSYMSDRWQMTKINKSFSSWSALLQGVPQVSFLGHILFNIYLKYRFSFCLAMYAILLMIQQLMFAITYNLLNYKISLILPFNGFKIIISSGIQVNVTYLSLVTNLSIYGLKSVMLKFGKEELLNSYI